MQSYDILYHNIYIYIYIYVYTYVYIYLYMSVFAKPAARAGYPSTKTRRWIWEKDFR